MENLNNTDKTSENVDKELRISDVSKRYSKDFKFTLKSKDGKILLQEVVTFGTEEQPFPENWKEDYFAQSSVLDYKQNFIDRNFDIDVSEDTKFDI
jgi:mRNA-degrading endonuclease YafQ of YafQ-DinJ toxin-antitoxin module